MDDHSEDSVDINTVKDLRIPKKRMAQEASHSRSSPSMLPHHLHNNHSSNSNDHHGDHDDDGSISEGSSFGGSSTGRSGKKRKQYNKGSDEYVKRRQKNNEAVKKSRIKSKVKTQETAGQVSELSNENEVLLSKVKNLQREFELLKDLYQTHAMYSPSKEPEPSIDLSKLMRPDSDG